MLCQAWLRLRLSEQIAQRSSGLVTEDELLREIVEALSICFGAIVATVYPNR